MRNLLLALLFVTILFSGCKENGQIEDDVVVDSPEPIKEPVEVAPIEKVEKVEKPLKPAGPAFFDAAMKGAIVSVKAAIKSGVDVNSQNPDKQTAIMLAAFDGHTDTVRFLIESGANVNNLDGNGRTALMFAASGNNPGGDNAGTVKLLLDNKAKVDVGDKVENFTALMFAAAEGQLKNVKLLLEYKADWKIVDVDGDTARKFAVNNGHTDVVKMIDAHAAKQDQK